MSGASNIKVGDRVRIVASSDWTGITGTVKRERLGGYSVAVDSYPKSWVLPHIQDLFFSTNEVELLSTKIDNNTTQPIKNDGERCIYCSKRTKELKLFNSTTRYCPDCETKKTSNAYTQGAIVQPPVTNIVDDEWTDMLDSLNASIFGDTDP